MAIESVIKKIKLKIYIAKKKHKHGLSVCKKNKWSDKYFVHDFSDVDYKKIIDLEDTETHRQFYTLPYLTMKHIESIEYTQYTTGEINNNNFKNYIEEVDVDNIIGDCTSNEFMRFNNLYDYISDTGLRTIVLQDFISYYYLFNMDKDEFIQQFINRDITYYLSGKKTLTTTNTVCLIKNEGKYYVVNNGRHRVLIAKLFKMGRIKAIVFNAD
ncbi:hypothetical protein [Staphylococcus nepalensis]|uniref:hypothetical protein n=1 Tax=Staphylococcus nepalensis TaxID=214473 RepID=UPI001A98F7F5|nr:hypothetical protein [Staphylococcus nepalensis]MBO1220486.1 hypothetical protein [Staphylococcus nepalensis]